MQKLSFGTTPFDRMTKEDLLLTTKRLYSALVSTRYILGMDFVRDSGAPFWTKGSGFRALSRAEQALDPIHQQYSVEDIFRSYFRYADDLLFTGVGFGWVVCGKCGRCVAKEAAVEECIGKKCVDLIGLDPSCDGVIEKLDWKHLIPAQKDSHS